MVILDMFVSQRLLRVDNPVKVTLHQIHNDIDVCYIFLWRLENLSYRNYVLMFEVL